MKLLISLLFVCASVCAQSPCEDFLALLGQRDINQTVIDFQTNCGPFEESISEDGKTKEWESNEKGITITFKNDSEGAYKVSTIELKVSTARGGYEGAWPFGFETDMDFRAVKKHIKKSKELTYEWGELGIRRSYFTYSGPINEAAEGKKVKVYIAQYEGRSITDMRLRLR